MSKRFIAFVLAGALTITSISAQPARAELSDAERFVIGIGTLLLLGTALDQAQREQPSGKKRKVTIYEPYHPSVRGGGREIKKTRRLDPLPAYCLRQVRGSDGPRRIFGARCLKRNYDQAHRLPNRCRVRVEGPRGTRIGYRPRCLRQAGFIVNR